MHFRRRAARTAFITIAGCTTLPGVARSQPTLPARAVSPAPILLLTSAAGPAAEFTRVAGAVRLTSGEVVVADGGSHELRVFSSKGEFVKSLSRSGEGPGELLGLMHMTRSGDTLVVLESFPRPSQIHAYTVPDGFLTRSRLRASNAPQGVAAFGRLATGELLVQPGRGFRVMQPGTPGALTRDSLQLGLLRVGDAGAGDAGAGDAGAVTWLGTFPNISFLWYENLNVAARVLAVNYTLGPALVFGVSGDRVWIGDSGTGAITLFSRDGTRVGQATMPMPPRPFDNAALERARQRALANALNDGERKRIDVLYSPAHRPAAVPRFSRFVAGPDGEMWVELYAEDPAAPARFVIFGRAGRAIGTATLPAGVKLTDAGRDYVVGVRTDADGVEEVGMWGVGVGR